MPDIPQEAWAAIDAALDALPQPDSRFERDRWRMVSRITLDTAAPVLAEAVAAKILRHMNEHGPQAGIPLGGTLRRAWRRHFGIAARVASFAFSTDEDIRRETAAALNRGDYTACRLPEEEKPAPRKREDEEPCRGFRWIGQSFACCDECGKPAWEHEGEMRLREGAGPFGGEEGWELRPWKPGEAEAIKRKWGRA